MHHMTAKKLERLYAAAATADSEIAAKIAAEIEAIEIKHGICIKIEKKEVKVVETAEAYEISNSVKTEVERIKNLIAATVKNTEAYQEDSDKFNKVEFDAYKKRMSDRCRPDRADHQFPAYGI